VQEDEEFGGFSDDDVRRISKRTSAVHVLHENLLKKNQPPANVQPINKKRTVDAKILSPHTPSDKKALSPLSRSDSDSSPTRGSLKGNIKVRLLLGRCSWLPIPKERHSKTAVNRVVKDAPAAAAATIKERKRRRLSSHESDDSVISSSGESDVKYSLWTDTVPRRGCPPLVQKANMAPVVPRRGRPLLHPAALVRARARQLVSKARGDLQVDKKPKPDTAARPWAPFWHGKLQLPTQSSRSSRKITINRRFLDDSYTSIGQPGLLQRTETEQKQTSVPPAADEDQPRTNQKFGGGSRVRCIGLLNRPLVARPAMKHLKHLQAPDKTAEQRPRQAKSPLGTKENSSDAVAAVDAVKLTNEDAPWVKNAHKSVHSNQIKKGSMAGQHCYICDSTSIVHHYYMCRVPCCRGCSRFYKNHCERGTKLDQLTCLKQGK